MIPPNQYDNLTIPLNNSAYTYENRYKDTPRIEGISLKNTFLNYPGETKLIGTSFFAFGLFLFIPVPGKQITNSSVNCLRKIGEIKNETLMVNFVVAENGEIENWGSNFNLLLRSLGFLTR